MATLFRAHASAALNIRNCARFSEQEANDRHNPSVPAVQEEAEDCREKLEQQERNFKILGIALRFGHLWPLSPCLR